MSLEEARARRDRGETRTRKDAPIGPSLGPDFWADAVLVEPQTRKSVHLRLQAEVYDFFVAQSGGKGHIKKMHAQGSACVINPSRHGLKAVLPVS